MSLWYATKRWLRRARYGIDRAGEVKMPARLKPNKRKILESILFLIEEAARRGTYATQYELVKSLFLADISHLEEHGRPITFDNYVAMKFGPVPSESYDMLKPEYKPSPLLSDVWPLWDRQPSPQDGANAFKYISPKRPANRRSISQTDVAALTDALNKVKSLGFGALRDLTHKHRAYLEAWRDDGDRAAYDMQYKLLLPADDEEREEEIVHASKYA